MLDGLPTIVPPALPLNLQDPGRAESVGHIQRQLLDRFTPFIHPHLQRFMQGGYASYAPSSAGEPQGGWGRSRVGDKAPGWAGQRRDTACLPADRQPGGCARCWAASPGLTDRSSRFTPRMLWLSPWRAVRSLAPGVPLHALHGPLAEPLACRVC